MGITSIISTGRFPLRRMHTRQSNSSIKYPVLCYCEKYGVCGCDDITVNSTVATNESAVVRWNTTYAVWNGTGYALFNGTLGNGTTALDGIANSAYSLSGLGWVFYTCCVAAGVYLKK